jgi:hypothetical protein
MLSCLAIGTEGGPVEIEVEEMNRLRKAETTPVSLPGVPFTLVGTGPIVRTRAPFGRT